ncbi:MAG: 3-isopropylmalate dehydratase small subunit [Candidatus Hadarchaeales archaeon]
MSRAWVFGDDISTDDIIAGRYLVKHDPKELGAHAMENIDPTFSKKVRQGDVIVGGKNFGCGSSREQAPITLKAAGVSAVVAESFARIFYRNAINQGLPVLSCKGIKGEFKNGDEARIDLRAGTVRNLSTGKIFRFEPFPKFMLDILRAGGLVPYMKKGRGSRR